MWKLNNTNNGSKKSKGKSENTLRPKNTYQNLWDMAKVILRAKLTAANACI